MKDQARVREIDAAAGCPADRGVREGSWTGSSSKTLDLTPRTVAVGPDGAGGGGLPCAL